MALCNSQTGNSITVLTLISCQAGSHHDKVIKNAQIEMSKPPADKKDTITTSSFVFITYISLYKTLSKKKCTLDEESQ